MEAKYHSFELEMLAVVKAVERFHIYLYGIDFTLVTDCHALLYAVRKASLNQRVARWTLQLQNYCFKVVHREGKRMAHVDALSRIVTLVDSFPLEKELQYRQLKDPNLQSIPSSLERSSSDSKYTLIDGLVFYIDHDLPKFVVPEAMIKNILRCYHDDQAHCGFDKTMYGIRSSYWFPAMKRKVHDYIDNCLVCLLANTSSNCKEGEYQLCETPNKPFTTLHVDHFGPLPESSEGAKHILLIVDATTRYTWLFPTRSTGSKEVIIIFKSLFHSFGNPQNLVSDRSTGFTSKEFSEFVTSRNIKHRQVTVVAMGKWFSKEGQSIFKIIF